MSRAASKSGWRFSFSVMLPVIVAVLVTVGTAAAFVVWSTAKSDDRAIERQTRLVSHILSKERQYILDEQTDVSPWDDAVAALENGINREWVDENLGAGFYESHGHHRIYVIDPQLRAVYAMRDGGSAPRESFEADGDTIRKMIAKLQTVEARSAMDAFENGFGDIPTVSDLAIIEGKAALVGVVPIMGESDNVVVQPDRAFFHIAVRFLDEALATELMDEYLIEGARFGADATTLADEIALELRNAAGETVAWFKWMPDRPGAQILAETAPAMMGALLVGGLIILLLMRRLQRSSSELEAARADAQHRALHDPLTGLANRAGFQERLSQAIAGLGRSQSPIALLALDLDKFKQVNDTLGHESGDQLLQQVAQRLQPLVRETDTIARLGGDEFAIIQTNVKSLKDSETLSDRIIARVSEPYALMGAEARIGVSIGVAIARSEVDGHELASRADFALYEAKDAGRNQYKVFAERQADSNVLSLPLPANANRVA
jgi:diguanylate cyclase (GGDEF)-like protein